MSVAGRRRSNVGDFPRGRGRGIVNVRSGRMCELHGDHLGHSFSHRKPASLRGGWNPSNGLRACGDGTRLGHGWIESNPLAAEQLGWRVPSHRNPFTVPAFIWVRTDLDDEPRQGWVLLNDAGDYITEGALAAAVSLGLPQYPDVPDLPEWSLT